METPEAPPPPPPPQPSSSNGMFLALIPIVLVSVGIFFFLSRSGPVNESDDLSAFNVSDVPEDDSRGRTNYTSRFERDAARRSVSQGPLAGFIQEKDKAFAKGRRPKGGSQAESEKEKRSRLKEEAFIKKHDKQIQSELRRFGPITQRYRKKYPIVKEVDKAFGKLPRYMALRDQYEKDHNAFDFVRNSIKLPEVRKTIRKYALKPETWRATIGMANEAMRKKPPAPIYDEAVNFMTHDKTMTKFVTDTTTWLSPRMGTLVVNGIPPGTDMTALKGVAGDIGAMPKTK